MPPSERVGRGLRQERVDVVVVGAGLAGLASARDLVARGRSVVVLEARDRVGGRTLNHTFDDGLSVELGGQWVGPAQDRILALADELEVGLYPSFAGGESLILLDGQIRRFDDYGVSVPADAREELEGSLASLDEMAAAVPLDEPWTAPDAERWDRMTFETWIDALTTDETKAFMRTLTSAVFAAEAWDISMLHFLWLIHTGGGLEPIIATEGGAQDSRIMGGSQVLSVRLAERLGDALRLNAPVREVVQTEADVDTISDGHRIGSDRVIVAVPPALAARIAYAPPLPALRDQLTQKVPMGSVVKCVAVYDEPFWRDDGLDGLALDPDGLVLEMHDGSPDPADVGVLIAFAEGRGGRRMSELPERDRTEIFLETFERFFGPRAAEPIHIVEKDWSADPWSRGCYGGHLGPGVWTQFGPALRRPCGRIHWAGTETADRWSGYMDGAVRSGERAAREVLALIR